MAITAELRRVVESRETLAMPEAAALMRRILAGDASEVELASLLSAMAVRGETSAELAGFAQALREAATTLPLTDAERAELVDTCGTGGDSSGTFNISTGAALVAAAAGAKVAKHGNRAVTSRCGSADVLEVLGVPVELSPEAAADALRAHGFCFLLAPAHHPGLRAVMPLRRAMGVRTLLHVMGPLLNPAGARRQVMGVYAPHLVRLVAEAMALLDTRSALVVHGAGGLDEISLSGPTVVAAIRSEAGQAVVYEDAINPEDYELAPAPLSTLAAADAQESAAILLSVFRNKQGPPLDIVVLNAAAVLLTAGLVADMSHGVIRVQEAVTSGAVLDLLQRLRTSQGAS